MKPTYTFILFLAITACTSSNDIQQQNIVTVQNMFDAFNKHQWQTMSEYYIERASFLDPSFGKDYVIKTRKETADKYAEMQELFPDIHDEVIALYPSGDIVTAEFISTGTLNDSISFKLPIVTVFTLKDGKIIRDATYYDQENP
jgi:ketosteroid isomerase-like protein